MQPGIDSTQRKDTAVADIASYASVPADPLLRNKFDTKASEASNDKSAKQTLHANKAATQTSVAPHIAQAANNQARFETGEAVVLAPAPQPDGLAVPDEHSPGITAAPGACGPSAITPFGPHAVTAAMHVATASQQGEGTLTAQSIASAPAAMATVDQHAATASQTAASEASANQEGPFAPEERADAAFAQRVSSQLIADTANPAQPAAVFAPVLVTLAVPNNEHHASVGISSTPSSSSASSTSDGAMVQAAPVRRLEISVHDPLLGTVDVRAEMRGGTLHASLTGAQDSAAAAMPALHQFLQQHDVNVHTLTYATAGEGVAATGSASSSSSDMGRDAAGRNFDGGMGAGSQQPQGGGAQTQQQRYGAASTGYDGTFLAPAYVGQLQGIPAAVTADHTLPTGSTLSIHI